MQPSFGHEVPWQVTDETVAMLGGTGAEGSGLALRWAQAGLRVIIGSRDAARARASAERIRAEAGAETSVEGLANAEAAARARLLVLTVPFAAQLSTIQSVRGQLVEGTVVVDVTAPLATAVGGRATRVVGVWEGSAAEQAAAAVPGGVSVVSAFHHLSAHHLADLSHPIDSDVLVCGDVREAKERVRRLVEAIPGARYVDAGPLANARIVESFTALLIGLNIRYKVPGAALRITGLEAKA
jgi:NADPH-dependent F420 reductase